MRKPSHWTWILGAIAWVIMSCLLLVAGYHIGAGYVRMTIGAQAEYNATEIASLESNLSALSERLIALQMSMTFEGYASWYNMGHTTANGEAFDRGAMTAASKCLPFGSTWRVTRIDTGKSVVVRLNDTLPSYHKGRIIDLAEGAARVLGMIDKGVTMVRLSPAY